MIVTSIFFNFLHYVLLFTIHTNRCRRVFLFENLLINFASISSSIIRSLEDYLLHLLFYCSKSLRLVFIIFTSRVVAFTTYCSLLDHFSPEIRFGELLWNLLEYQLLKLYGLYNGCSSRHLMQWFPLFCILMLVTISAVHSQSW